MTGTTETTDVQAIQFNGLDDYLRIVGWMKDCGDTYALADEIRYTTPIMLLQTTKGTKAANPGDWIVRGVGGRFSVDTRSKAETDRAEDDEKAAVYACRVLFEFLGEERFIDLKTDEYDVGKEWTVFYLEDVETARCRTEKVAAIMRLDDEKPVDPFAAILGAAFGRRAPERATAEATSGGDEQTDWATYHPCGTCLQQTGEPCRFTLTDGGVGKARVNPHPNRERLPAA